VPLSPLLSPSGSHGPARFPQTPVPFTMSRAGMMLTSGAFASPSARGHRSVRLKDLGSGHGFMHSENGTPTPVDTQRVDTMNIYSACGIRRLTTLRYVCMRQ
jgi:hypothetical protein